MKILKTCAYAVSLGIAVTFGMGASSSAGTVNITWTQTGGGNEDYNIIFRGSGSIDLNGLGGPVPSTSKVTGWNALGFGNFAEPADVYGTLVPIDGYTEIGCCVVGFDAQGDKFGFLMSQQQTTAQPVRATVTVPEGYKSGDQLNFTWTYQGTRSASELSLFTELTTLASFGPEDGTNQKQNQITIRRGGSNDGPLTPVPLPAALPLLVFGLGTLRLASRRKA